MSAHRRTWAAVVVIAALMAFPSLAQAGPTPQTAARADALDVFRVRPGIYLIAGAGCNIVVQVGADGVVVVDSGSGQRTDAVLAAIRSLSDQPIRFVIDTSGDDDHVGGNERIAEAGRTFTVQPGGRVAPASIVGHEGVLTRMSAPNGNPSPVPAAAWPTETFTAKKSMYFNGEGLRIVHQPAAHSDGDSVVLFRRSDVVVAGEIFDMTRFPIIDVAHGGSIDGEIAALSRLVDLAIPPTPLTWQTGGTQVIPAHGRVAEQAEVLEYRDMVAIVRDVIQDMIGAGLTLDQIKAASPTKGYTSRYGSTSGSWTTDMFVEAIYTSLTARQKPPRGTP